MSTGNSVAFPFLLTIYNRTGTKMIPPTTANGSNPVIANPRNSNNVTRTFTDSINVFVVLLP